MESLQPVFFKRPGRSSILRGSVPSFRNPPKSAIVEKSFRSEILKSDKPRRQERKSGAALKCRICGEWITSRAVVVCGKNPPADICGRCYQGRSGIVPVNLTEDEGQED